MSSLDICLHALLKNSQEQPTLTRASSFQTIYILKKNKIQKHTTHYADRRQLSQWCRSGQKVINVIMHSRARFNIFPKRRKGNIAKKTHIIHYSNTNYDYPVTLTRIIVQRDTNTVVFRHTFFFGTGNEMLPF